MLTAFIFFNSYLPYTCWQNVDYNLTSTSNQTLRTTNIYCLSREKMSCPKICLIFGQKLYWKSLNKYIFEDWIKYSTSVVRLYWKISLCTSSYQLPGVQELHDRHLPAEPSGVSDLHRLPQEPGWRRVCDHEVGGERMRLFPVKLEF